VYETDISYEGQTNRDAAGL